MPVRLFSPDELVGMRRGPLVSIVTVLTLAAMTSGQSQTGAQDLKGPIPATQGTTDLPAKDESGSMAGLGTAGDNAVMTQDMLLVNPAGTEANKTPAPLTASIGMTLKVDVNHKEVLFKDLRGLVITVINETNKPLIIDSDNAVARLGNKEYKSANLTTLQLAVLPEHGIERVAFDAVTIVAPAAASMGAVPTVKDIYKFTKPPITKYGRDQQRRAAESSRFGKRILWPHEKTEGIVYFKTEDSLDNAGIEIPVTTLFDNKNAGKLICLPVTGETGASPTPAKEKPAN